MRTLGSNWGEIPSNSYESSALPLSYSGVANALYPWQFRPRFSFWDLTPPIAILDTVRVNRHFAGLVDASSRIKTFNCDIVLINWRNRVQIPRFVCCRR
jgi:hypothetical protein